MKLKRKHRTLNIQIPDQFYNYLLTISHIDYMNMTQYVTQIIKRDMEIRYKELGDKNELL